MGDARVVHPLDGRITMPPGFADTTTATRLAESADICDGRCGHAARHGRRSAVGKRVRWGVGSSEFERIGTLPDAADAYARQRLPVRKLGANGVRASVRPRPRLCRPDAIRCPPPLWWRQPITSPDES